MEYLLGVLLAVYVFYRFLSPSAKKTKSRRTNFTPKSREEIEQEAMAIAEKVKTPKGLESLRERLDNADMKLMDIEDEESISYLKTEEKYKILEKAVEIAEKKPYRYYYDGICDIFPPEEIEEKVGRLLAQKEFEEIPEEYREDFDYITIGDVEYYTEDGKKLDIDEFVGCDLYKKANWNKIKKIKNILASDLDEKEKEKKIDEIVRSSEVIRKYIDEIKIDYDIDEVTSYGVLKEYIIYREALERFEELGISCGDILIENGYYDIDALKNMSKKDLMKLRGIGVKRAEEILEALEKIRTD